MRDDIFAYMKDAKEFCLVHDIEYGEIEPFKVTEPFSHTTHNIRAMFNKVMEDSGATSCEVYLTGEGNYRYSIAYTQEYKGNRDRSKAPTNLEDARSYIQSNWGATVVNGCEADDYLGIRQYECLAEDVDSCIASTDKDLDMIEGWHYNITKKKLYIVDSMLASYNFYHQLLTGDRADNVRGIYGCGDKTADKILKDTLTDKEMYEAVRSQYHKVYGSEGDDLLMESAHLLWIQREPGVLWTPPDA